MKLTINTKGMQLSKVNERFQIKYGSMKEEHAATRVEQIIITNAISITSDALELASQYNIDVIFLNKYGNPYGRLWHSKMGSISTIRRKQLELTKDTSGTILIKEWVSQKISNQINLLSSLKSNRTGKKVEILQESIEKLQEQLEKIQQLPLDTIDNLRNTIEGHEGTAGRIYFKALSSIIPKEYEFSGRSRNPAKDMFNCMLNYAYGVLYSNVERSCIIAGLDPYIGIMHTDNYNKTALVFDLIEMYRAYMDEIVFKLFSTKKVKKSMFDEVEGGYWLNKEGKVLLIDAINKRFAEKIKYKGRNIELENIIQYDCHNIANRILKEDIAC